VTKQCNTLSDMEFSDFAVSIGKADKRGAQDTKDTEHDLEPRHGTTKLSYLPPTPLWGCTLGRSSARRYAARCRAHPCIVSFLHTKIMESGKSHPFPHQWDGALPRMNCSYRIFKALYFQIVILGLGTFSLIWRSTACSSSGNRGDLLIMSSTCIHQRPVSRLKL
jgi:hypothetical protein